MSKTLILMRGAPGSGKSYLAREILKAFPNHSSVVSGALVVSNQTEEDKNSSDATFASGVILSTDDFFVNKHGVYEFDRDKIGEAHEWNQQRCFEAMATGKNPIIIDNTNIRRWEMKPYFDLARDYGYYVEMYEPKTPWWIQKNVEEMASRNSHGVDSIVIKRMVDSFERVKIPNALVRPSS